MAHYFIKDYIKRYGNLKIEKLDDITLFDEKEVFDFFDNLITNESCSIVETNFSGTWYFSQPSSGISYTFTLTNWGGTPVFIPKFMDNCNKFALFNEKMSKLFKYLINKNNVESYTTVNIPGFFIKKTSGSNTVQKFIESPIEFSVKNGQLCGWWTYFSHMQEFSIDKYGFVKMRIKNDINATGSVEWVFLVYDIFGNPLNRKQLLGMLNINKNTLTSAPKRLSW